MKSIRQNKTSKLLQKVLGEIFQLESRNLFKGAMITVTEVRLNKDLSIAKVYLSLFATKNKDELFQKILGSTKIIRYNLAKRVKNKIRTVPELEFYIDDSLDYIENIENLLKDK